MREQYALVQNLERISQLIVEGCDLESTLDRIVDVLARVLRVERCSVMLKTGREWLRMRGARGIAPEVVRQAVARLGEGIAGGVALNGEARLLVDAALESGREDGYACGSAICVPLRVRGEVLGVVNVSNRKPDDDGGARSFDEQDLLVATVLANQAALAIEATQARENAREHQRLRGAMSDLEARLDSLQQQAAALALISQVTDAVVSTGALDEILPGIVRSTCALLGATRGSIMLVEADSGTLRIEASVGIPEDVVAQARPRLGEGIAGRVAQSGEALLIRDAQRVRAAGSDDDARLGSYRNPGALCVPLRLKGDVLGVLNVNDRADQHDFTEADLFVAQVIAHQAALAISNSRLLDESVHAAATRRALEVAREIQQSFLPPPPRVPGFEVAGRSEPCDETGGDYIDYEGLPADTGRNGRLFLAVGDVTGHGVGSALIMSTSRAFLRALLSQSHDLEKVFERLNDLVAHDLRRGQFMTLFAAIADAEQGTLTYTAAGHPPPFLLRAASGALEELEGTGPPLGVLPGVAYPAVRVGFAPGDLLVVGTDGVWEAANPQGESWGRERFAEAVRDLAHLAPEALLGEMRRRHADFAGAAPRLDDFSLVALRRAPREAGTRERSG